MEESQPLRMMGKSGADAVGAASAEKKAEEKPRVKSSEVRDAGVVLFVTR